MKYKLLRAYMKKRRLTKSCILFNSTLIIDGCCFKQIYKNSGCSYILGGEYDRFASHLRNILNYYIKSNIKCYVIFNGATDMIFDVEKHKRIQQEIITRLDDIKPGADKEYCEPLFTNDVCIDVLKELGIKYYICRHDFKETLLCLARRLRCPVVTNNYEYALYDISVVQFRSVVYDPKKEGITCLMYCYGVCRRAVWKNFSDDMMSLVLAITDEDSDVYSQLLDTFQCIPMTYIHTILCWSRCQNKESAIAYIENNVREETRKQFLDTFAELRYLFSCPVDTATVMYILNSRTIRFEQQFEHAIGTGRIISPFFNLMHCRILSGSLLIYHQSREDAMLPAVDIALYGMSLLTKNPEVKITFIGRVYESCVVKIINKINNISGVKKRNLKYILNNVDHFQIFLTEQLPGFDMEILKSVPEDCWILLITLLYYSKKSGRHFTKETYCIILSYVLLGPVSEKVGLIKRNNLYHGNEEEKNTCMKRCGVKNDLTHAQCNEAANAVVNLFCLSETGLGHVFDRDTLHTFAEFQHCLYFMNHLNKLCGQRIKCTAYHNTINCTFIYKMFVVLKDKTAPGAYIESILKCPPVYSYFKNILHTYYQALALLILNQIIFV